MLRSRHAELIREAIIHSGLPGCKNLTNENAKKLLDEIIDICDRVHEEAYSDGYDEGYSN